MLLRTALLQDTQAIADLEQALFPANWLSAPTIANEFDRGPCFVLIQGPAIVGYLIASYQEAVLDILRIGVDKHHRGYGLGEALLRKVLVCKHRRAMLTVQPDNVPAVRLYKKLGFRFYGQLQEGGLVLIRTSSMTTGDRSLYIDRPSCHWP